MSLSTRDLARLGELLDVALEMTTEQRAAWLEALPAEDRPLLQALRQSLLSNDPAGASGVPLDSMPRIGASDGPDGGRIERKAGERLGAYELIRPLGAGGMGEVWLASRADGAFERQVALKIPHLHGVSPQVGERFARECRILATLETPNIARLYDAGVDSGGAPYIAMEYVQGEPLIAWCDARGLDTPARIRLFMQVLDAVDYAHRRDVLHRDLKPSNILVTGQGEVRLLDFGVARLLRGETGGASLTQDWGRALTPAYASPELLRGDGVDLRSDISSLGVLLHELVTGLRPGPQPSGETGGAPHQALAGGLRDVVKKALAPDPADRYSDTASFARALQPFGGAMTTRMRIGRVRKRSWLAAGLAALAVLVAGVIVLLRPSHEPAVKTIAVLPFTNLTGDPAQEIVADGLAEELANQLAAIPELRVTGRRSSFSFKGSQEDLRSIATKLGVTNLLEGSMRGDGGKLRVTVQLVDGADGMRRWSSRAYEHPESGILAAQDEIAQDVARALAVTLDVGALSRMQGGTTNLEAAKRYWEWRELTFSDRTGDPETARRRVLLMREAVRLDPQFAVAWDGLAWSLKSLSFAVGNGGPGEASALRAEMEEAWQRVQELAPESWPALLKRAYDLRLAGQWAESETVARQALETGPLSLDRAMSLMNLLFAVGRISEEIELRARIIALEPRWIWVSRDQQKSLHAAGRFDEAEAEYQRSRALEGDHAQSDFLALLRRLARQDGDAQTLRDLLRGSVPPGFAPPQWVRDFDAAIPDRRKMLGVLRAAFEAGEGVDPELADALGDRDLAFALLDRRIRDTREFGPWWQAWMLVYSGARADPRFKQLMREAGLSDYWRQSGNWPDFCGPDGEDDFKCG